MLFIQANSLPLALTEGERRRLLDALEARGFRPLIRAARLRFFESLLGAGTEANSDAASVEAAVAELQREAVAEKESARGENGAAAAAYTPGELFCAADCVFSLVFGASAGEGLSAAAVYSLSTAEPLSKLESFCREVRDSLDEIFAPGRAGGVAAQRPESSGGRAADSPAEQSSESSDEQATEPRARQSSASNGGQQPESHDERRSGLSDGPPSELPVWKTRGRSASAGLARFIATQPAEFVRAGAAFRGGRQLAGASELMETAAARRFLRRVQEMRREGYTPRRIFTEAQAVGVSVEQLLAAGLLEREVRVSCRQSGHALFDLPTPDSLAAITISKAKCSLCAAPVADEVIEETINPTRLAVALLEDGRWLGDRVYRIVRALGVPDSEIATGPPSAHGESSLAADVCGASFLFVTKDSDLTPAFCRRVGEIVEETEATHLVVVVTGAVEDEARLRLYEFAWRRARDGHDLDATIVEGLDAAHAEIERAFERAVNRELSRHLYPLNAALGLSASNFVIEWFRLANAARAAASAPGLLPPARTSTGAR